MPPINLNKQFGKDKLKATSTISKKIRIAGSSFQPLKQEIINSARPRRNLSVENKADEGLDTMIKDL